ncbi:aspartate--tRNA ligase 2, cytoplasmic-like protein, partial [Tanacetum coccineum]
MEPNKPSKKALAKAERLRRRQEAKAAASAVSTVTLDDTPDPLSSHYGDIPFTDLQSPPTAKPRVWTTVKSLGKEMEGETVLVRGRVHEIRPFSKKAFIIVR